ncbi:MAG: crotonase/enoyl-CoA hydratase family protein [Acidimicrobiales bacterium]|nr:crotonase/enoyl-CoA hydratase family protein [Acidimicrobiales bacterium]
MNDSPVTIENTENVATVFLDDGKANALGYQVIDALLEAFDEVEASDANALVLAGRPDRFSAGFDLSVMNEGSESARGMLTKGVDLFLRMYMFSRPVVAACTGHAIAAGSILLLCSDLRVGSEGDFKVGLPEVTIGMALPFFATELARDRLSKRHYTKATALGSMYSPEGAVDAGFLDEVVPQEKVISIAQERARSLSEVGQTALTRTRETTRGQIARTIRESLSQDLSKFDVNT